MAETTTTPATTAPAAAPTTPAAAPTISQGQTTAAGQDTHAAEAQPQVLEGQATEAKAPSIWDNWILWAVAALWIYLLFGSKKRRQQKAADKKEAERRNTLQKGDELVTIGRMHGTVVAYTDSTVTVKPDTKSDYTMTFDRAAIFRIMPRPGEEADTPDGDGKKS